MPKRLLQPHALLITLGILLFIWGMNLIRLNLHYLDPFNNGIKDYEVTDIVYTELGGDQHQTDNRIRIVNSGRPDRARIARLVNRLDSAGAGVIGLDFYFPTFGGSRADSLLASSLDSSDRVVLACTLWDEDPNDDVIDSIGGVHPFFGGRSPLGYGNFPSNATRTVRLFSPEEAVADTVLPSFTSALLRAYAPDEYAKLTGRGRKLDDIYFTGHKEDFVTSELDWLLDSLTLEEVSAGYRDRIVLVGYAPADPWDNPLVDRHYTPLNPRYNSKSIPDMYGIVIHANILNMVLSDTFVRRVPAWLSFMLSVLICYGNVLLFSSIYRRFHQAFHGITRLLQLVQIVFFFFLTALLFYAFRLKIDLGVGILGTLLAYDFIMIYKSLLVPRVGWLRRMPVYFEGKAKDEEE